MTAVREEIFAHIEACLAEAGIANEVERMPSSDPAKFPALHIFDEGDDPDEGEAGTARKLMTVRIEGYVETGNGREAHGEANQLYARIIELLFTEPVLGSFATEIEEGGLRPAVANLASKRRLGFDLTLLIYYATRRGEPQTID